MYSQTAFKLYSDAVMARHHRRYTTQHSFNPVSVPVNSLPSDELDTDTDLYRDYNKLVGGRIKEDNDFSYKKISHNDCDKLSQNDCDKLSGTNIGGGNTPLRGDTFIEPSIVHNPKPTSTPIPAPSISPIVHGPKQASTSYDHLYYQPYSGFNGSHNPVPPWSYPPHAGAPSHQAWVPYT